MAGSLAGHPDEVGNGWDGHRLRDVKTRLESVRELTVCRVPVSAISAASTRRSQMGMSRHGRQVPPFKVNGEIQIHRVRIDAAIWRVGAKFGFKYNLIGDFQAPLPQCTETTGVDGWITEEQAGRQLVEIDVIPAARLPGGIADHFEPWCPNSTVSKRRLFAEKGIEHGQPIKQRVSQPPAGDLADDPVPVQRPQGLKTVIGDHAERPRGIGHNRYHADPEKCFRNVRPGIRDRCPSVVEALPVEAPSLSFRKQRKGWIRSVWITSDRKPTHGEGLLIHLDRIGGLEGQIKGARGPVDPDVPLRPVRPDLADATDAGFGLDRLNPGRRDE